VSNALGTFINGFVCCQTFFNDFIDHLQNQQTKQSNCSCSNDAPGGFCPSSAPVFRFFALAINGNQVSTNGLMVIIPDDSQAENLGRSLYMKTPSPQFTQLRG
jgi:hypothetical protein